MGQVTDPVATLTALAAHFRLDRKAVARAAGASTPELWDTVAEHVDGVIERHFANIVRVCDCCKPVVWPCPDVRELLAVAEALGINNQQPTEGF